MAHDRSHNDQIHLTHEFLSLMLGTRRAGVTTALNGFDSRGWITHSRGCITIVERTALQDFAGGLYLSQRPNTSACWDPCSLR
jgi:Crp-like helix-turn-helix domain